MGSWCAAPLPLLTRKQSILQRCTDCTLASTGFFALHDLIYIRD